MRWDNILDCKWVSHRTTKLKPIPPPTTTSTIYIWFNIKQRAAKATIRRTFWHTPYKIRWRYFQTLSFLIGLYKKIVQEQLWCIYVCLGNVWWQLYYSAVVCKSCCDFFLAVDTRSFRFIIIMRSISISARILDFFLTSYGRWARILRHTTCVCASLFLNFKLNRYLFQITNFQENPEKDNNFACDHFIVSCCCSIHFYCIIVCVSFLTWCRSDC